MAGIRDLLGLIYWMDNAKGSTLEALFQNKKMLPKERLIIIKALEEEKQQINQQKILHLSNKAR